jgi:subtilisin family serine protease
VRRGVLVAIDPDPLSLQLASRAGFRIIADERQSDLGLRAVILAVPRGLSARQGLKRLRSVAPAIRADFDHLFEPAGGALLPFGAALAASAASRRGPLIGIVDGGVASNPSLKQASIEQKGFAGDPQPTGHGTAVASLIVGNQGPFRGAATSASLLVADVYGGSRAAGSATTVVRALAWLASKRPRVINISLVGPQNGLVQRAVAAVRARGIHVVAAVGNDGPAAPPQYPASYPGVVAVTGVDARGKALPEAGKSVHLDFAAPGADMAAALPGQGYARVRGTSFAAPLAAARLAITGSVSALAREARPGRGRVGRGIVCGECRVEPKAVRAK